ncbi:putative ESX-3 secretion system protein [Mycolicibacterium conceptionense]|uniref:Putative ESX-3 secretion system protein n=1 Tax=Mycolicibacterium conceptionense TaxID=451644 RepID=A0A0U1DYA7_9MYCO|nr:type VII secretion protein EccB [Mycolicibacterium conceptionense]CQD25031.1 putative ESX-3 secretion system protein [Mycolicibacterium conceptionense]
MAEQQESDQNAASGGSRWRGRGLGYATRVQVTAHQFNARRAVTALTRWYVGMESDQHRRQSMAHAAGATIVVVICLGALFWSFLRPAGSAGQAKIIADQNTNALYVRVGDTLRPVLNLASARLIAGSPDNPVRVRNSEIESRPRGTLVGIPGAPDQLTVTSPPKSSWLVCDAVTKAFGAGAPEPVTVTVIDGQPDLSDRRRVLDPQDAVLLRYDDGVWLIRDGRRSKVDPAQRPVLLALGVSADDISSARPMSKALFDAIPVGSALSVPVIPKLGEPAGFPKAPGPVGTVVSTPQVGGDTTYSVVLANGMQTVSPVVAQILQNANGTGAAMPVLAGPALADLPVADSLDVSAYPDQRLRLVDTEANPATCWWWQKTIGEGRAQTSLVSGPTVPIAAGKVDRVVSRAKPDPAGALADKVYFGPDAANYVASTGNDPAASTVETQWFISEWGARFGVPRDQDTERALGFGTATLPAPWVVLKLLTLGPVLSKADAAVTHDILPTDQQPGELRQPK